LPELEAEGPGMAVLRGLEIDMPSGWTLDG